MWLPDKREIILRQATWNDAAMILKWRNAKENRCCSLDERIITKKEHINWFKKVLKDKSRLFLIAEDNGKATGVLRYDIVGNTAMVSIYLKPGTSGKGIGSTMLRYGSDWLRQHVSSVTRMEAKIIPGNIASIKAFAKVGFRQSYVVYEKILRRC